MFVARSCAAIAARLIGLVSVLMLLTSPRDRVMGANLGAGMFAILTEVAARELHC